MTSLTRHKLQTRTGIRRLQTGLRTTKFTHKLNSAKRNEMGSHHQQTSWIPFIRYPSREASFVPNPETRRNNREIQKPPSYLPYTKEFTFINAHQLWYIPRLETPPVLVAKSFGESPCRPTMQQPFAAHLRRLPWLTSAKPLKHLPKTWHHWGPTSN